MAWEWVSPVAAAVTGVVGIGFTWWAGHQGRKHAEKVAKDAAVYALAKEREARRAAAYLDILTTVQHMTAAIAELTSPFKYTGGEALPAPALDEQIAASTKVSLYGTQAAQDLYEQWFGRVRTLIGNHTLIQMDMKQKGAAEPGLWAKQEPERTAMIELGKQLSALMNSELTS